MFILSIFNEFKAIRQIINMRSVRNKRYESTLVDHVTLTTDLSFLVDKLLNNLPCWPFCHMDRLFML